MIEIIKWFDTGLKCLGLILVIWAVTSGIAEIVKAFKGCG